MPSVASKAGGTIAILAALFAIGQPLLAGACDMRSAHRYQPAGKSVGKGVPKSSSPSGSRLTEEEAIAEFERRLGVLCAAQDDPSANFAASAMREFLPGKTAYGHIWRTRVARASASQVQSLVRLFGSKDYLAHSTAIEAVSLCGDAAIDAVPALSRLAQSTVKSDRFLAEESFERLGGMSKVVRARLTEMTLGTDLAERLVGVRALRQWNWHDSETANHLLRLIRESDDTTAQTAAKSLSPSEAEWKSILPVLFEQIESKRMNRAGFLVAIPEMNPQVNPYIPRIVNCLTDASPEVRAEACEVIARLGKYSTITHDVRSAREGVLRLERDPDEKVRLSARQALRVLDEHQRP